MSETAAQINVDTLITYLQQQQSKGETHVHLDEQAKLILREFYIRAIGGSPTPPSQVTSSTPPYTATTSATPPDSTATATPTNSPPAVSVSIQAEGSSSAAKIQSLTLQAQQSAAVKELGTLRDTLVFSAGNPDADVMLIGDAPGFHEESQQTPFAGPAGKKLDGILTAMGLSREKVYLTYLVKYRPSMENQTTNNRTSTKQEVALFIPYIHEEIKTVRPKVIITLGSQASRILLKTEQNIDQLRAQSHTIGTTPARATYHPSYLLSNDSNEDKRKLWEDMLDAMRDADLPISEKQLGFFKSK